MTSELGRGHDYDPAAAAAQAILDWAAAGNHSVPIVEISISGPGHPSPEPGLTTDGREAHHALAKFEPGFEGWQPGQVVRSRFLVSHGGIRVADSVVADVRRADEFTVSPEALAALQDVGAAEVYADVVVTGLKTGETTGRTVHPARIETIHEIQQPFEGDCEALAEGDRVLLEGEVVAYSPLAEDARGEGEVLLRLPSGQLISAKLPYGTIDAERGSLGVIRPMRPLAGDRIQLRATWRGAFAVDREVAEPGLAMRVVEDQAMYIKQPSPERLAAYAAERKRVAAELAKLQAAPDPAERRAIFSRLVVGSYAPNDRGFLASTMTAAEQEVVWAAVTTDDPNHSALPVEVVTDILPLQAEAGIDFMAMTPAALIDFVRTLPSRLQSGEVTADLSDLAKVLREIIPQTQLPAIFGDMLHDSLVLLRVDPANDAMHDLAHSTLHMLATVDDPATVRALARGFDQLEQMPELQDREGSWMWAVVSYAVSNAVSLAFTWEDYQPVDVDHAVLDEAILLMTRLKTWLTPSHLAANEEELKRLDDLIARFS